jgi:hypothetical protein
LTWGGDGAGQGEGREARAKVVRAALASGRSVTAFANNHFAGHAPASAEGLAEVVRGPGKPLPGNG